MMNVQTLTNIQQRSLNYFSRNRRRDIGQKNSDLDELCKEDSLENNRKNSKRKLKIIKNAPPIQHKRNVDYRFLKNNRELKRHGYSLNTISLDPPPFSASPITSRAILNNMKS